MAWLEALELPAHARLVRDSELRQLDAVDAELAAIDAELAEAARDETRVRLLMTIPGVNYVVALGLLAALGDISRFRDGDHAASYLGLVPSTRQSGRKCYHGPITKAGSAPGARAADPGGPARQPPPRPDRGVLPPAGQAEEPQRGDHGGGPQAGDDRLPDAQEQRAVPLRQAGADAREVRQAPGTRPGVAPGARRRHGRRARPGRAWRRSTVGRAARR